MFDIMKPTAWDDMWKTMDALMQYPLKETTFMTNGLRKLINRPHNIVNVKDENGNVVAQKLEVVTTPFKKKDVKVTVSDDMLHVECGTEATDVKDETDYLYKGISTQTYSFALKLGNNIDKTAIKASNVDGVLTVTLPFKEKEQEEAPIDIEVE